MMSFAGPFCPRPSLVPQEKGRFAITLGKQYYLCFYDYYKVQQSLQHYYDYCIAATLLLHTYRYSPVRQYVRNPVFSCAGM